MLLRNRVTKIAQYAEHASLDEKQNNKNNAFFIII
jgi:hypothetical protein